MQSPFSWASLARISNFNVPLDTLSFVSFICSWRFAIHSILLLQFPKMLMIHIYHSWHNAHMHSVVVFSDWFFLIHPFPMFFWQEHDVSFSELMILLLWSWRGDTFFLISSPGLWKIPMHFVVLFLLSEVCIYPTISNHVTCHHFYIFGLHPHHLWYTFPQNTEPAQLFPRITLCRVIQCHLSKSSTILTNSCFLSTRVTPQYSVIFIIKNT